MSTLHDILIFINQLSVENQQLQEALKQREAEKLALEKKVQTLETAARDAGILKA